MLLKSVCYIYYNCYELNYKYNISKIYLLIIKKGKYLPIHSIKVKLEMVI